MADVLIRRSDLLRREKKVDRLADIPFERFERHDAGLSDPGIHLACYVHTAAPAREIEDRSEMRQIAQVREFDQLCANLGGSLRFNVKAGFRDIVHGNRHIPWVLGLFHRYQSFVPGASSSPRTVAA